MREIPKSILAPSPRKALDGGISNVNCLSFFEVPGAISSKS